MTHVLSLDRLSLHLQLNSGHPFNFEYIRLNYAFKGNSYRISPQVVIRKLATSQERNYQHSFTVWVENVNIGTLSTDHTLPTATVPVKFEFENAVFYQKPGFVYYLDTLAAAGLVETPGNPSYFEIPLDIQLRKPLLPRLSHMERHSTLDEHNPRPKFRPLRKKSHCSKLDNGSMYAFGRGVHKADGTGKQVVVYNKTNANKAQEKPYIDVYHVANGLAPHIDTERVEAKVTARWLAANNIQITARDLANPEVLKTLFLRAVGDVFRFIECKPKKKPKRNAQGNYPQPITDLLPLSWLQASPVTLPTKPRTATTTAEISDNRKRTTHKVLVTQYVAAGTPETAATLLQFEAITTPPQGYTWPQLRHRYALNFDGAPTPENSTRITQINALLHQHLTSMVNLRG